MSREIDFSDLITHRGAWRNAIEIARDQAEVRAPDIDDRAYWEQELLVFDRTLGILDRTAYVDESLTPENNLDRFFDVVSDKRILLSSGGIRRDAMFTMPVLFTNEECVYELLSDFTGAVSHGGLMEYISRGHCTNEVGTSRQCDAKIVDRIVQAFIDVDKEIAMLITAMTSDARHHAPHIHVYSDLKKDDLRANTFGRWQARFDENQERIAAFVVSCINGIDPECDLLEQVDVRPDFDPGQSHSARWAEENKSSLG
jgi:hypothetical protein